jgi:23S rRNA pseudouridine2605 synthase
LSPERRGPPERGSSKSSAKESGKGPRTARPKDSAKPDRTATAKQSTKPDRPTKAPNTLPGVRLQKLLSASGISSRRHAETLMEQGRVRVNGRAVTVLGARVDPEKDVVEVDGRRVEMHAPRWILLNKPAGTLTTMSDPGGRPTVYSLLPRELRTLRYVGRLDLETEGLLLFTNQGDEVNRLTHPSGGYEREYHVGVEGGVDARALAKLVSGVELDDGMARASKARLLKKESAGDVLSLVLLEGRKREVRRLLDAIGHGVRWLRRVRFGALELGSLALGEWRDLTGAEVKRLLASPKPPEEKVRRGPQSKTGGTHARKPSGSSSSKDSRSVKSASRTRREPWPAKSDPAAPKKGFRPVKNDGSSKDGASRGKPAREIKVRRGPGARGGHPSDR